MRSLSLLCLLVSLPLCPAHAEGPYLLVGDSHSVMDFGRQLTQSLGGASSVVRYAVAGASSRTWLNDPVCAGRCPYTYGYADPSGPHNGTVPASFPGAASLLRRYPRHAVLVALGTNDANNLCHMAGQAGAMTAVNQLLAQLGSRPCVWVGPPVYRRGSVYAACGANYDRFVNQLATTVSRRCQFIDSRRILDPRTGAPVQADRGDLVHFQRATAEVWARGAAALISRP